MKVRLGDVFTVSSGGTPNKREASFYENGTIPWVKTGDLKGKYVPEEIECITEKGLNNSSAKLFPKDTVLIAMYGATIGACSILPYEASSNQACAAFLPSNDVLPEYLFYFLSSKREQFVKDGVGGAQPNISAGYLKNVEFVLIPIIKQEKIICGLTKVDDLISLRKQQLAKLDELVKSRFVEMFGRQSHNEKGLPYLTIDDVAEIYLGITHTPTYVDEGVMFISARNTSGDFLDLSDVKYISREEFEGAPKGSKPQKNDVLFSRVGSNLGHPVILEDDLELCTFVSLGFLRTKGRVTSNYLKHWMRDDFFATQVKEHVKGGGQPNLNTGWLKQFRIIVPDMELQIEFDRFCKQTDKSKLTIQQSLDKLETLKKALMQEYFG